MEEDIKKHSLIFMFRGTPCMFLIITPLIEELLKNINFLFSFLFVKYKIVELQGHTVVPVL